MRKQIIFLGILSFLSISLFAQDYLSNRDSIKIIVNEFQEKLIIHTFREKQTLFSLAKFYGLKINELYYYNPEIVNKEPQVGQAIKIPVPNRSIVRERDSKFNVKYYAPVFYSVQKSEGLKKIAEGYFNMKVDSLKKRNKISTDNLQLGQKVLIGWISIKGIPAEMRTVKGPALLQTLYRLKTLHQTESVGKTLVTKRGTAFWQKDSKIGGELYALHRDCPINSVIAIHNPMKNKTIYAKVVGRIPEGAYESSVEVIVSPKVAKLLGALDPKFFVKIRYYK